MKKLSLDKNSIGAIVIFIGISALVFTLSNLDIGSGLENISLSCEYKTVYTRTQNSAPKQLNQKYDLVQIGKSAGNTDGYEGSLGIGSEAQVEKGYSLSELSKKDIEDELYMILKMPKSFERIYITKYFNQIPINVKIERMDTDPGNYTLSVDTFKYDNGSYNGTVSGGYTCATSDADIMKDVERMLQGLGLTTEQYKELLESIHPVQSE